MIKQYSLVKLIPRILIVVAGTFWVFALAWAILYGTEITMPTQRDRLVVLLSLAEYTSIFAFIITLTFFIATRKRQYLRDLAILLLPFLAGLYGLIFNLYNP